MSILARTLSARANAGQMIQSITLRKGHALAEPIWRTAPWLDAFKDTEQILYDLGLSLACLLEQADKVVTAQEGALSLRLLEESLKLSHALDQFRDGHLGMSNAVNGTETNDHLPPPVDFRGPPITSTLGCGGLAMTWWAIKAILVSSIKKVADQVSEIPSRPPFTTRNAAARLYEQLTATWNETELTAMGRTFLIAIEARLQSRLGHFRLSRTIFPVMAATLHFHTSVPDLEICLKIKEHIASENGFRLTSNWKSEAGRRIFFQAEQE